MREDTICFTQNYFFSTALLGFTPNKHEGKLTGLAAHGITNEELFDFFEEHNQIENSLVHKITSWENLGKKHRSPQMIINKALLDEYKKKFEHIKPQDVAHTVQKFTEQKVLEYIAKNIPNKEDANIALAGGLFANVVINEAPTVRFAHFAASCGVSSFVNSKSFIWLASLP